MNKMLSLIIAGLFAGGLALAPAVSGAADSKAKSAGESKSSGAKAGPVSVTLGEQNGSKETGTAQLTSEGADKTRVVLTLKGGPAKVAQPAHIHDGSCAKLDPKPKYPLSSVENGKSTTVVPVSLESLTGGNLAINVHKSSDDIQTYVACGDIKK